MPLISDEYLSVLRESHVKHPGWGTSAGKHADIVQFFVDQVRPRDILDYGCGKGELFRSMHLGDVDGDYLNEYDPAIVGREKIHQTMFDMVCCIDVLEHIEPDLIDDVLAHLGRLVGMIGYFVISTRPASHILPDGRNAHLIVKSANWWREQLIKHFGEVKMNVNRSRQEAIVLVCHETYPTDLPDFPPTVQNRGLWLT